MIDQQRATAAFSPDRVQVLCVGTELELLEVRCAVLEQAGYKARNAIPREAEALLTAQSFDVVILSATLSDEARHRIRLAAGGTPAICLEGVTFPQDLLNEVQSLLTLRPGTAGPSAGEARNCR